MNKRVVNFVSFSVLSLIFVVTAPAWSVEMATGVSSDSIDGAGRNIMRTADGGIVAAFSSTASDQSSLVFSRSLDNGRSWNNVLVEHLGGSVKQAAIDSNFQGSYIAFTEIVNGQTVGRIAYSSAPFAVDPLLTVSESVTPEGVLPQDTFIQASRAGWGNLSADNRETVVYGWQDAISKGLYIGVSPDGKAFPEARLVVADEYATSGPAVAIRGNYVIATYQTLDPAMAPRDVDAGRRAGRTYPAWFESVDGGKTWSEPKPLFGLTAAAFPTVGIENEAGRPIEHRLAGGSILPNSPILNWNSSGASSFRLNLTLSPDKTLPIQEWPAEKWPIDAFRFNQLPKNRQLIEQMPESDSPKIKGTPGKELSGIEDRQPPLDGITFVQTSMKSIIEGSDSSEISIVSFRLIKPDAEWTHVIANNRLTMNESQVDSRTSVVGSQGMQFQYSALIDTAVRATTYQELDSEGQARFVAAVSTDTGKTFDHHISLSSDELEAYGIDNFGEGAVFAASQCLYEDRDGIVHIDVMFTNGGKVKFASIPLGVNAAKLREDDSDVLVHITG